MEESLVPVEVSKPTRNWRWVWWVVLALGLGGAAAGGYIAWYNYTHHTFTGGTVSPIERAYDFTLIDQTGQSFTLSDLEGKWILLNYGYTTCPDVCPATLAVMGRVQTLLGEDIENVEMLFVTVDPERDTPEKMGDYVDHFGQGMIALTGTAEEIAAAAEPYGVRYARVEMPDSVLKYAMNHTAFVYLINPDFEWIMVFPFGITAEEMASDLDFLMRQGAE
ncbi:MAG: SCO family protein [Chloroflexi bacterium]|nr:SCO family protein [Chloroflexota bacterium]MBP8058634.1 SCO family protein [Chloroflexota bacterium]